MKLLMISTDKKILEKGSPVALRQIEYAKKFEEINILLFSEKGFSETALSDNVFVYPTKSISKWFYYFDAIKLGEYIIKKRGITHITCQDPFITAMVGVSLKKKFYVNLEIQIHTDIGSPYFTKTIGNKIKKMISNSLVLKADHIRVVSSRIKKYLMGLSVEPSLIEIRPIGIREYERQEIDPQNDLHKKYPQFDKIILMASRLEKEKNIDMAIEAVQRLTKDNKRIGLVIVGSGGEEKNLKNKVNDIKAQENIIFEGWNNDLQSYYKTCDVFLLTSWYEGYAMTLKEACDSGCKIVSTDVGIAGDVGAIVVGHSVNEISNGLEQALR